MHPMLNGYWQNLPSSSQNTATHAPGSERHTYCLVHPHAQVAELPDIGHVAIAMYRATHAVHPSHQNCTLAYVDCQAFVIGIPQETVHLRLKTLLTSVNDRRVISKEQMRNMPDPRLATL
jgi:hypothetical protein